MNSVSACASCGGKSLFKTKKPVDAGGGYAPDYLPGLGGFMMGGKFDIVVCQNCGFTHMFATSEARARLIESSKWERA